MPKPVRPAPRTLHDGEIATTRSLSRRAALALGLAAAAVAPRAAARAHAPLCDAGFTDGDQGPNRDQYGHGRGPRPVTGRNDNDIGARADPTERGQGAGISDGDRGAKADPPSAGRAGVQLGLNDGDTGPNEDPAGRGRGDRHRTSRNDTDRSSPRGGDPPGQGR